MIPQSQVRNKITYEVSFSPSVTVLQVYSSPAEITIATERANSPVRTKITSSTRMKNEILNGRQVLCTYWTACYIVWYPHLSGKIKHILYRRGWEPDYIIELQPKHKTHAFRLSIALIRNSAPNARATKAMVASPHITSTQDFPSLRTVLFLARESVNKIHWCWSSEWGWSLRWDFRILSCSVAKQPNEMTAMRQRKRQMPSMAPWKTRDFTFLAILITSCSCGLYMRLPRAPEDWNVIIHYASTHAR